MADESTERAEPESDLVRGALEALCIVAGFVALGLAWVALEAWAGHPAAAYPERRMTRAERREPDAPRGEPGAVAPAVWLIDGYNVLHAGILRGRDRAGWWSASMQARVVERVAGLARPDVEVWVIFDAAGREAERVEPTAGSCVRVVLAPSADEWLVHRVKADEDPTRLAVVTADRKLAARARHHGAAIVSPRDLLSRCPPGTLQESS